MLEGALATARRARADREHWQSGVRSYPTHRHGRGASAQPRLTGAPGASLGARAHKPHTRESDGHRRDLPAPAAPSQFSTILKLSSPDPWPLERGADIGADRQ
jgi:hypothetical protein